MATPLASGGFLNRSDSQAHVRWQTNLVSGPNMSLVDSSKWITGINWRDLYGNFASPRTWALSIAEPLARRIQSAHLEKTGLCLRTQRWRQSRHTSTSPSKAVPGTADRYPADRPPRRTARALTSATLVSLALRLVSTTVGMATAAVLARHLGVRVALGVFSLAVLVGAAAAQIADMGVAATVAARVAKEEESAGETLARASHFGR